MMVCWTLWTGLLLGGLHLLTEARGGGGGGGVAWGRSAGTRTLGPGPGAGLWAPGPRGPGALSRRRREALFPSGVKLCSQETLETAVRNHLDYFHLRVCQETVWEAYKIFWDRLPDRKEYHDWLSRCLDGSVSVIEIGRQFSQSQEHIQLIRTRVEVAASLNSVPTSSAPPLCSTEPPAHGDITWT
ncbi:unnamed protein product, partial [Boreogadus saida]